MPRFTRRRKRKERPPKVLELRGGGESARPPIRDPHRTKTYMMPTYGECMFCGRRETEPRYHSLVTTNEDDPPMVGITGSICDECHNKHQQGQGGEHGA